MGGPWATPRGGYHEGYVHAEYGMMENEKSRHEWIIARFYGPRKDKVTLVKSRVGIPKDTDKKRGWSHT